MAPLPLPRVITDDVLPDDLAALLEGKVERLPWATLEQGGEEVHGILSYGHGAVTAEHLARLPNLRVISNYGVGVDHIDVRAATRKRLIPVGNTPDVLNGAVADQAMALLLAAGRRLREGDIYARSPEFLHFDPGYMLGTEVHHQTVGIVGLGGIGYQIARRCAAFDMNILYHRRTGPLTAKDNVHDPPAKLKLTSASLDELLERSDFVVIIVPLTKETTGLIGKRELAKMKKTAVLVNVARGPVVDTEALTEALKNGEIYAAGLDVTDPEPLPRDHPLLAMDNVIITPHLGSATTQTRRKMAELTVLNLMLGLSGKALKHSV